MKTYKSSNPKDMPEWAHGFPVKAPEYFNFAYDVIDWWAKRDRNKLALIWTNQQGAERRFTFHELSRLSNQAANLLLSRGVGKGDRVMMMLPRVPEWWIFSLALIKLGAVQCSSPTLLTPADILYRLNFCQFKVVISDRENAWKFDEIYEDCPTLSCRLLVDGVRPDWDSYPEVIGGSSAPSRTQVNSADKIVTKSSDPLLMVFTSGTNKHPKSVLHTCDYPLGHRVTAELWHGLGEHDLHITMSDTGWAKNLWGNIFGQWVTGACLLSYDIRGKFHAGELLPLIEKYEVTSFCAPPTIYRMLILNDLTKFDLSSLRNCTAAGEPLHTETVRIWKEGTGITIREGYGQTETCCLIGEQAGDKISPGAMGKAMPGWDIEIHDEDGKPLPDGEDGRIAVKIDEHRPVGLIKEYFNSPDENAEVFQNGYYYTGDRAYRDKDGYFWFLGRADDIIKSSGYRIGPSEVEDVLVQHPAVLEAAVVGAPDPMRGTLVKAYIRLRPGFEPSAELVRDLQGFVKTMTAPYKYPRLVEFFDNLPKTFSGKIKRNELRKHAETGVVTWE